MRKFKDFEKEIEKEIEELTKNDSQFIKDFTKGLYHKYITKFMFYFGWIFPFKTALIVTGILEAVILIGRIFNLYFIHSAWLFAPICANLFLNISLFITLTLIIVICDKN